MNQKALLEWYDRHKRELPFRQDRIPYRIWISEIMAQQTRIEAMMDHYRRFLEQFPDVRALSEAEDDALMKAWQGLGYYSRARSLKKAAIVCMEDYEGVLPQTKAALMKLPGIGPYTAGAIASIAHGERVSAIDGNVIRVYARYLHLEDDFSVPRNRKKLEEFVEEDLPQSREEMMDWNQALMELGALVCTPRIARCEECPLSDSCKAFAAGDMLELPVKKQKKARRQETKEIFVLGCIDQNGQIRLHLNRRPETGLLAGLYEFDTELPPEYEAVYPLGSHRHIFSHVEWQMDARLVVCQDGEGFLPLETIEAEYSIPSAFAPFYERAVQKLRQPQEEK